jgi:hypothetical protein
MQLSARKRRKIKERKKKFKFTGERTDTRTVGTFTLDDGRKYIARRDGSWYPIHTSISVSQSVSRLCDDLAYFGNYHNYDELFLDLAEIWLLSKKPGLNKDTVAILKASTMKVMEDCRYRQMARKRAIVKRRNRPRKTLFQESKRYR